MIIFSVVFLLFGVSFHLERVSQSLLQELQLIEFRFLCFLGLLDFITLVRLFWIC